MPGNTETRRPRRWGQPGPKQVAYTVGLLAVLVLLPAIGYGAWQVFGAANAAGPPAGFTDTLVAKVEHPTALAFTPDGRLLITTQAGRLWVYEGGAVVDTSGIDLSASVCTERERGLLGVAVDPGFATNHFVYLYYTFKKHGGCEIQTPRSPVNRVARFTLPPDNVIDPATETVLVDNIPSYGATHNAGDLQFGKDGYLYISVGDGGRDYANRTDSSELNQAARDEHVLLGKILRITPAGDIPPDNPFLGPNSARCAATGRTEPGRKCQETFAWGLRNPFRIAFDQTVDSTRFYINVTGQHDWESIYLGQPGADYGWNLREGHCARGSKTDCGQPPPGITGPLYAYPHDECAALTAGTFVPPGVWPATYDGAYLFGDFVCGTIFRLIDDGAGEFKRVSFVGGLGAGSIVTMRFGPHDGSQALYYTTYANGGEVRRIAYTSSNK